MDLVAILLDDVDVAREARAELAKMEKENLVTLADAVVVYKNVNGDVQLDQAVNLTAAGAVSGAWWGTFLGALLGLFTGAPGFVLAGRPAGHSGAGCQMLAFPMR